MTFRSKVIASWSFFIFSSFWPPSHFLSVYFMAYLDSSLQGESNGTKIIAKNLFGSEVMLNWKYFVSSHFSPTFDAFSNPFSIFIDIFRLLLPVSNYAWRISSSKVFQKFSYPGQGPRLVREIFETIWMRINVSLFEDKFFSKIFYIPRPDTWTQIFFFAARPRSRLRSWRPNFFFIRYFQALAITWKWFGFQSVSRSWFLGVLKIKSAWF